jgi:hypothetical protein
MTNRSAAATRWSRTRALAAGLIVFGLAGAAPSPDTFNVELIVFRYNGTQASPENWDVPDTAVAQNPDTVAPGGSASSPADNVRPLSSAQFQLAGTETALRRNSAYEPIAHFGYRVKTSEPDAGTPVRVEMLADAASGLSGTVSLQRGRFLHLALDLAYTTANPPAKLIADNATPGPLTFHLHQDRRMRPFERHYFDHPAFGVVAIITPVGGSD